MSVLLNSSLFLAQKEAYGISQEDLVNRYDLVKITKPALNEYHLIGKGRQALVHLDAGDEMQTIDSLSRLIHLAARNQLFSLQYELVSNSDFQRFSRSIIGIESASKKLYRGVQKAAFLARGCFPHFIESILVKPSYWHEVLLPSHPYGADIADYFDAWSASKAVTSSFEDWMAMKPRSALPRSSVCYLNEIERQQFETVFHEARIFQNEAPLQTDLIETDKKEGYAIYVLSLDKKFYVGPYKVGHFHHTSFVAGAPVLGAGEIRTNKDGEILTISSKSGHYKPTAMQLYNVFEFLHVQGVDLTKVELIENQEEGLKKHPSVQEFMNSSPKPGSNKESF